MIEKLSTGRLAIKSRKLIRRYPKIKRAAERLLSKGGAEEYERLFQQEMLNLTRPGDIVWDVGANVGHYTKILSDAIGEDGIVVAFEPAPGCQPVLTELARSRPNVVVQAMALSNTDGQLGFDTSGGATHVNNKLRSDGDTAVRAARADSLIANNEVVSPDVVKVDVEGFEAEVLEGFAGALARSPRAMLIEVHFGQLASRGLENFPDELPKRLRNEGFKTKWIDPSHLAAVRRDPSAQDSVD